MVGKPSDMFFENIEWKSNSSDDSGLIWLSPSAKASGNEVQRMLDICRLYFDREGFDMPVTLSFATSSRVIAVIGIHFNKNVSHQRKKAHELFQIVSDILIDEGFYFYRLPTHHMNTLDANSSLSLLRSIKHVTDTNSVLSFGRYGIT